MDINIRFDDYKVHDLDKIEDIHIIMVKGDKGDSGGRWGEIDGNMTNQLDLTAALNTKADNTTVEQGFNAVEQELDTTNARIDALGNVSMLTYTEIVVLGEE